MNIARPFDRVSIHHKLLQRILSRATFGMMLATLLLLGTACSTWRASAVNPSASTPVDTGTWRAPIQMQMGKVRPPLEYRIVSFHRGRADKRLIRLASQLGFNGVQIQIEGSTVEGIKAFAKYDETEGLVKFCHELGMSVTLWVHEMSDVPGEWMPEYLGPVTVDNAAIWSLLETRYEWMLRDAVPNVDGLVLTVVETKIRATDTAVMVKLAKMLREKCDKYGKSLCVRTFVWYADEFKTVMAAVDQLPKDQVIMSKCVPQDWNIRGMDALEIGAVGNRPQIEEFDVAGEYFLKSSVPNCMVDLLKRQFDYGMSKGIQGICVRVDRDDDNVLHEPNEVNLWTLAMLAGGVTDKTDDIWTAWANHRFGEWGAPGVVEALKPTAEIVSEMLSVGPLAFGDTRIFPALGDQDFLGNMRQNWQWDDKYLDAYRKGETGDPAFVETEAQAKPRAEKLAAACVMNLDLVWDRLDWSDYQILRTRLLTLQRQCELRGPMILASLYYRQMLNAGSPADRIAAETKLTAQLDCLRKRGLPVYPEGVKLSRLGKTWKVGQPETLNRDNLYGWIYNMDLLRQGKDPRPIIPGHGLMKPVTQPTTQPAK